MLEQNRTKEMIQKGFSQVFQAKDEVWLESLGAGCLVLEREKRSIRVLLISPLQVQADPSSLSFVGVECS